jgi:hypothetical protein
MTRLLPVRNPMDDVPPFLRRLIQRQRLAGSDLSTQARKQLRPLFVGGVLVAETSGRGEIVEVRKPEQLLTWVRLTFPSFEGQWQGPAEFGRAQSIALRRSSKAAGSGIGAGVLHLRAMAEGRGTATVNGVNFPVRELTAQHGVAACLIRPDTQIEFIGQTVLIENLECFLNAERILPEASIFLNGAGRLSDQLIACLGRSTFSPAPVVHFPDYDPVGLSDYLRLKVLLGPRVVLYLPSDIERRFAALGDQRLISEKPRNRALLEKLATERWPCPESKMVFDLIKESGAGLEQESLLLNRSR